LVAALLGATGIPGAASAQDNTGYGTTAAEFLLLGAGARGTALGGAFAAMSKDVSSLYYNPAGAALMTHPGAMVGTYSYVADTRYSWGGLVFPFGGGSSAVGIQLGTFGFKDQKVYTPEAPNGTGATYSVSETFAGITFAKNFSDRFSAGLTAKGIFDQLGSASGTAYALDFGTNFHAALNGHPVNLGFTLTNLGTSLKYSGSDLAADIPRDTTGGNEPIAGQVKTKAFNLPTSFRVALAYDVMRQGNNQLSVAASFDQPNNNKAGFGGAFEWQMRQLGGSPFGAAVRGSYSYAAANKVDLSGNIPTALSDEENLQGLAFGGGLEYAQGSFDLSVDYAFKYMGILGSTNFVSVSLGW
jgi:hypothetical protein